MIINVIIVVVVTVVLEFILTLSFPGHLECALGWIWGFQGLGLRD